MQNNHQKICNFCKFLWLPTISLQKYNIKLKNIKCSLGASWVPELCSPPHPARCSPSSSRWGPGGPAVTPCDSAGTGYSATASEHTLSAESWFHIDIPCVLNKVTCQVIATTYLVDTRTQLLRRYELWDLQGNVHPWLVIRRKLALKESI